MIYRHLEKDLKAKFHKDKAIISGVISNACYIIAISTGCIHISGTLIIENPGNGASTFAAG